MQNSSTLARRLAYQMWGEVNNQKKIAKGVWLFSCSGHGGFIVDNDVWTEYKGKYEMMLMYKRNFYRYNEQHFSVFEEDCDWAILINDHPELLNNTMYKLYIPKKTFSEWVNSMLESAKSTVAWITKKELINA